MIKSVALKLEGETYYPQLYSNEFPVLISHYTGETFGGGVVFYTWSGGTHGLIAALDDIGVYLEPYFPTAPISGLTGASYAPFGWTTTTYLGATGLTIGSGRINTQLIVNYWTGLTAGLLCSQYTGSTLS